MTDEQKPVTMEQLEEALIVKITEDEPVTDIEIAGQDYAAQIIKDVVFVRSAPDAALVLGMIFSRLVGNSAEGMIKLMQVIRWAGLDPSRTDIEAVDLFMRYLNEQPTPLM